MRARLALAYSGVRVELREVVLKDKPPQLLALSAKATVPVLQRPDGRVIDESIDIMYWALQQSDPDGWLHEANKDEIQRLIATNDQEFKYWLDRYKYADRFPEEDALYYREHCEKWLQQLEQRLQINHGWLIAGGCSLADMALLPFVRQCAHVDLIWFEQSQYQHVVSWLNTFKASHLFNRVMKKYPQWNTASTPVYFPSHREITMQ